MGRYILLKVDSNAKAEILLERLKPAPSVEVIGIFPFGKNHCDRKGDCAGSTKLIRSKKWGTLHCPNCKLPLSTIMQTPRNLLRDPEIDWRLGGNIHLSINEPYVHPLEKHGEAKVEQSIQYTKEKKARGAEIMARHRRKTRRTRRRKSGG